MTTAARPSRKIALATSQAHSHGTLGYLELGRRDAPCVVFLHGFGADLLTWQLCLVPLAAHYRVIAVDLPGHGRTSADVGDASLGFMTRWLDEVFDVLDIREAHLVGHSMGAKIALAFTLAHAERVASLALISPAGLGGDFHHARLDAFLDDPDQADDLARHLLGPKGGGLVEGLSQSLRQAADPARVAALQKLMRQSMIHRLAHANSVMSPEGFDWSQIRVPLTLMWGDHDRLIPLPEARRLPPSAPVHIIDGAGHLPHMEASGAVVAHLKAHLFKDFLA
jgi:pyruvate dehydrogenase E2 component (dihydrolipoamide acetyltransferase)